MTVTVFAYLILISIDFNGFISPVFDHISKQLKVLQKYSAARRIFNSLLGVWKCEQTRFFVFDILRETNHRDANNKQGNIS